MRFSLKTVLAGAIGLLALAAVGQGLASAVALSEIEGNAVAISQQALPAQNQAEAIGTAVRDARLRLYRLAVASPDAASLDRNQTALTDTLGELSGLRQGYQERLTSPRDRAVYERFTTAWNAYQNIQLQVVELMIAGDQPGALALVLDPATGAQNDAAVASLTEAIAAARAQTEANVAETVQEATRAKLIAMAATVVGLAVAAAAMLFALFGIARPIQRMTGAMGRLAEGDETVPVPHTGRRDEIGAMAAAVQVFKDNLIHTRALERETAVARDGAEVQRRRAVHAMAEAFEAAVGGVLARVAEAALGLRAEAEAMTGTATHTAERSATVAGAAQEAALHVGTVAAAAEELGASVLEIGRQVDGSADLARGAVVQAGETAGLVQELSVAAGRIGDVVRLITDIAGQTNLLALNATIEAARAGMRAAASRWSPARSSCSPPRPPRPPGRSPDRSAASRGRRGRRSRRSTASRRASARSTVWRTRSRPPSSSRVRPPGRSPGTSPRRRPAPARSPGRSTRWRGRPTIRAPPRRGCSPRRPASRSNPPSCAGRSTPSWRRCAPPDAQPGLDSFIRTSPDPIRPAARIRLALACSPSTARPTRKAPTAPMPVQIV